MTTAIDSTTQPRCHYTRRQALALSGSILVTGLPTLAVAAVDPEAGLLNLWTRYRATADARAAAEDRLEALRDVYTTQRPTIPDDIQRLGYDGWRADCNRLADSLGFTAAQADVDRLDSELWSIRAEIATTPVRGYPGLRVKALILAEQLGGEGPVDPAIADSVLADLGGQFYG